MPIDNFLSIVPYRAHAKNNDDIFNSDGKQRKKVVFRCALSNENEFAILIGMKKNIYYAVIGLGVILAVLGFILENMSPVWGVIIAVVAAISFIVNTRNEKKVAERLKEEKDMFNRDSSSQKSPDTEEQ